MEQKQEETQKRSYYAIIPANVRYSEQICDGAKLLYGEITALCNEKGYCWATNQYFATLYKKSIDTIARWIRELKRAEVIDYTLENNNERKIFITGGVLQKCRGGTVKMQGGYCKNAGGIPIYNNKFNTTNNNTATDLQSLAIAVSSQKENNGREINELIEMFKPVNPCYERFFSNKSQRAALERLLKKLGREKLERILKVLPAIFGKAYAPRISTPIKLEEKLADLFAYLQERSDTSEQGFIINPVEEDDD